MTFEDSPAPPRRLESLVASSISAARLAQVDWSRTSLRDRLSRVRELRRLISVHASVLAQTSSSSRGRNLLESLSAEVLPLAEACRFLERHAQSVLSPRRLGVGRCPLWLAGLRGEIHREPFGVVLVIGPGNYPLLLPGLQLIQALAAGNAVLLKPGPNGTPAARALIRIIQHAGFDSRLVTLLPESTDAARVAIEARPDKVIFTGSATNGERILARLAPLLIPATLELSGCDAVLIRADADLELAVKALTFGLTLNNGATCICPKRVFVHRSVATELEGLLARAFEGTSQELPQGNHSQLRALIEETVAQGAHFISGDITAQGALLGPIILGGVTTSARLLREDVFAPVLALDTVTDDSEAISRANDCPYALAASVFSRDESTARSMAASLNAGVVTVNDLIIPTADARLPFGGRKRSGFGVTRGAEGLLELTTTKVVTVTRSRFRPGFEPPHPADKTMFEAYLCLTHERGIVRRVGAFVRLCKAALDRRKHFQRS